MFCVHCGAKLPAYATFCSKCGNRLFDEGAGAGGKQGQACAAARPNCGFRGNGLGIRADGALGFQPFPIAVCPSFASSRGSGQ
jgi:hypothetical protein